MNYIKYFAKIYNFILDTLSILVAEIVIEWAKSAFIHDQNLIREMFFLIYRQYNALGEVNVFIIIRLY